MKRILSILLVVSIFAVGLTSSSFAAAEEDVKTEKAISLEENEPAPKNLEAEKIKKYNLPQDNMFILDSQKADVNGDGQEETVYLLGKKYPGSPIYMEHVYILVESSEGDGYVVTLTEDGTGSYAPGMTLADLTGDGVNDVMVSLPTGGSGGIVNYYAFMLKDNEPRFIFDSTKDNMDISGIFIEDYKAKLSIKDAKNTYELTAVIDLKDHKQYYDEANFYKDGEPQGTNTEVMPYSYYLIEINDTDNDGVYELQTYQSIRGICGADVIAQVIAGWKWVDGGWEITRIAVEKTK